MYFKHQKGGNTLSLIVGRAQSGAFIQVITGGCSYRIGYPAGEYLKGKTLKLGGNYFSERGISLNIDTPELKLTGRISYSGITPLGSDIMGPFRHLPMQCRHSVISMHHRLSGGVCLNGELIDFTGGAGYIEGDCGSSFPRSYTWVQCSAFSQDCSIMASAAHIPLGPVAFWGCTCAVLLGGVEYRLATYTGAKILRRDETQLLIAQRDMQLYVKFLQPGAGQVLDAPVRGRMDRRIREAASAPAYFELRWRGQVLFKGASRFASYEYTP